MFEHETNNVFDMFGGVLTAYARPCMPYQPISGFVVVGSRKVVVGQDPFEGTRRSKAARWLLEGTSSLTIPVHTVPSEAQSGARRSEKLHPRPILLADGAGAHLTHPKYCLHHLSTSKSKIK